MTRREELVAGLAAVEDRVVAACTEAGRPRTDVTVIAVSKTWPASDIALVHGLGVRDVAENKDQEAAAKAHELSGLAGLRWHFVGQLQTNKARSVAGYADVVHSLDRGKLARALSAGAERAGRELDVLVQVSLEREADGRGGVAARDVPALADETAGLPGLRLAGVMGVAPLGGDPERAFALLREAGEALRAQHPGAVVMSAGMSGDLEQAVRAGATHLRVGTALFGHRGPLTR